MTKGSQGRVPRHYGQLAEHCGPTHSPISVEEVLPMALSHWEEVRPGMGRKLMASPWSATLWHWAGTGPALALSPACLLDLSSELGGRGGLNQGEPSCPPWQRRLLWPLMWVADQFFPGWFLLTPTGAHGVCLSPSSLSGASLLALRGHDQLSWGAPVCAHTSPAVILSRPTQHPC